MKPEQYFKGEAMVMVGEVRHAVVRYSYETKARLYDVAEYDPPVMGQSRFYAVNGAMTDCSPTHTAIIAHFSL